jgi:uncharacterized repeat protein (TIGR03803 family)
LYQLAAGTRAFSTLVTFNGANGSGPRGKLIVDAAGNLYGTTGSGGPPPDGGGTIFKLSAGTHALTTLASFNQVNGNDPSGLFADAAGNFYGTTSFGGSANYGTVYRMDANTHATTTLVTFNNANGAHPQSELIADAAGNMYGTTNDGGANGRGTVFEVDADTHALTTLVTFDNTNGSNPFGPLVADAHGDMYGTTTGAGNGSIPYGSVFEIDASTKTLTTLAAFNLANGRGPQAGLILDAAGNLYGTTRVGGPTGDGTVFKIDAVTHAITTLVNFDKTNGYAPTASLLPDAEGNLFGTTGEDRVLHYGTVFELTDTGFVVPEPASLSLVAFASLPLLCRRPRATSRMRGK